MSRTLIRHAILTFIAGLALAGLCSTTQASDGDIFIRAEIGMADTDFDVNRGFMNGLNSSVEDHAYAIRGGYYFNSFFGLEAFYRNIYEGRVEDLSGFDSFTTVEFFTKAKLHAYGIGVVGKKRFSEGSGLYVHGRAGIATVDGRTELSANPCGGPPCFRTNVSKKNSLRPYLGVGVGYDFNRNFGLDVNYDVLSADFNEDIATDSRTLSLGLEARF